MTIDIIILIWLLPLMASSTVTSGQKHNSTNVLTEKMGEKFTQDQLTTHEVSSSSLITRPSTKPSLLKTQKPSKTFSPNIQTAPTSITKSELTKSATREVTSPTSNPTISTSPSMLTSSSQGQGTTKTIGGFYTHSTSTTQPTKFISTTQNIENTSPVTAGDATHSTGSHKTPVETMKTTFIHFTKAKRQNPPEEKGTYYNKVVAGLIGGALALMMVGFLVIYIMKRKLQRQQVLTTRWAGPSPFLDGGVDDGHVTLRSSNRISFASFLPQRLSKRLSLLQEMDQELVVMTPGTTFGDKLKENTSGQQLYENNIQKNNGSDDPEMKNTGDTAEMIDNSASRPPSK